MSMLKKLIDELCPEGMEYRKLVDEVDVLYGYPFDSRLFCEDSSMMPLIRIRDVKPAKASTYYSGEIIEDYRIKRGDILVGMDGNFNLEKWNDVDGLLNQRVCKLTSKNEDSVLNSFIYYYLKPVFKSIEGELNSGTVIHLSAKRINKIEIPIPPLSVQQEIVKILDSFTALEAELETKLEAELNCRKRQYEYYRDELFNFATDNKDVKWMTLGEIGKFTRGNGLQKKDFTEEGFPCIHYGQIYTRFGLFTETSISFCSPELAKTLVKAKKGDVIIACTSENVEDVCKAVVWLGEGEVATGGHACVYSHNQNPKYIAYYFSTEHFFDQKKRYAKGVKVIDIKAADLEKIEIPLPPLPIQEEIVRVLDRLTILEAEIEAEIKAEIAARRKQYEYYREKLLTFKRKTA